jgi:hypothetical protein
MVLAASVPHGLSRVRLTRLLAEIAHLERN